MSKARFQFTLPHVAAFTVWLAVVFTTAHYAMRLDKLSAPFLAGAMGGISLSVVTLGFMWLYKREALRDSLSLSRLLLALASTFMLIGAGVSAYVAVLILARAFDWALSLPLLALSASLAATVFLMLSSHSRPRGAGGVPPPPVSGFARCWPKAARCSTSR